MSMEWLSLWIIANNNHLRPSKTCLESANDKARVVQYHVSKCCRTSRPSPSYVDPFTGWFLLYNEASNSQIPISVRQRSPCGKIGIDLDDFDKATKTLMISLLKLRQRRQRLMLRGTVAKAPATFKDIMHAIMKKDTKNQEKWGLAVAELAKLYHKQVLLDFECFQDYVNATYGDQG